MIRGLVFVLIGVALLVTVALADFEHALSRFFNALLGVAAILYGVRSAAKGPQKKLIIRNYRFCAKCGYDVRASKDLCSECGWPIRKDYEPIKVRLL